MNRILLFALWISAFPGWGQLPENLKYDALSYSDDSATVLIHAGKTNAVYDLVRQQYGIEPSKNRLVRFPGSNHYAEIHAKTGRLSVYINDPYFTARATGNVNGCYVSFQYPETYPIIDCNGILTHTAAGGTVPDSLAAGSFNWSQFRIAKMEEGRYNITSYVVGYNYLNIDEEWVYQEGFYHSGVFDLTQNRWIIDPVYKICFSQGGQVGCLSVTEQVPSRDQLSGANLKFQYGFDRFEITAEGTKKQATVLNKPAPDFLAPLLEVEALQAATGSSYYVVEKDGKMGFLRFELLHDPEFGIVAFDFQPYLAPQADWVAYEPTYAKLIRIDRDSLKPVSMYHVDTLRKSLLFLTNDVRSIQFHSSEPESLNEQFLVTSDRRYSRIDLEGASVELLPVNEPLQSAKAGFGLRLLDDTLLLVFDAFIDYKPYAVNSILYPDEDSLDAEGNVIYTLNDKAFAKSGVYDLVSRNWLIAPQYCKVYALPGKFVCTDRYRRVTVFDRSGKLLSEDQHIAAIHDDLNQLKFFTPYATVNELFEAPDGYRHHTKLKGNAYYAQIDNKLGLYKPEEDGFESVLPLREETFLHYNPDAGFYFFLKDDSIYFELNALRAGVSRQNGKIAFVQPYLAGDALGVFQLILTEGADTTVMGEFIPGYDAYTVADIQLVGDALVVNDHTTRVEDNCENCTNETGQYLLFRERHFESENSSVWKQESGSWQQVTPYYATVCPVKKGRYIAASGHYYERSELVGNWGKTKVDIPSRYFLLDSNFRAIPFLDYFDFPDMQDLGFGIKIKLDNGYSFFVTYEGIAITDAAWHDFELENGKLKAILQTTYLFDEEGNQVFDEFGYPVQATTQTIKYFKLPVF